MPSKAQRVAQKLWNNALLNEHPHSKVCFCGSFLYRKTADESYRGWYEEENKWYCCRSCIYDEEQVNQDPNDEDYEPFDEETDEEDEDFEFYVEECKKLGLKDDERYEEVIEDN